MRKRPVFYAALLLVLLILFYHDLCGLEFYPLSQADSEAAELTGQVGKAEIRSKEVYLYLQQAESRGIHYPKVILILDQELYEASALQYGNQICCKAVRRGFRAARNEGNFEEEVYYRSLGVAELFEESGDFSVVSRSVLPLHAAMQKLKESLTRSLEDSAGNAAGIFLAIVTGDRSGLDAETKELYRKSGVAHILAISGLHISLIGMGLYSFLRKRIRFSYAAGISGFVMICFCLMSGESASSVRAVLMFLLHLLAFRFGKRFDLLSAIGLAAIVLLLSQPMYLYHSGFQLSFGAVCGMAILAPALSNLLLSHDPKKTFYKPPGRAARLAGKLKGRAASSLIASLSVTLAAMPVVVNSYYEVPLFSVLLNLIVVPFMGLVLESGLFSAFLGMLSLFLGRLTIGAGVYLVSLIELICALNDAIPFSVVITGHMESLEVILYLSVLGLLLLLSAWKTKRQKKNQNVWRKESKDRESEEQNQKSGLIAAKGSDAGRKKRAFRWRRPAVLLAVLLILSWLVFSVPASQHLELVFFDVDQGDCILLESPSGAVYMIDGGSAGLSSLYQYRLESALKYRGIRKLDYVIVTHPDKDHISGILEMLEEHGAGTIPIRNLLIPEVPDNENYQDLLEHAENAGTHVQNLHTGHVLRDGQITLTCLHPADGFRASDVNDYSAVLCLEYGSFRALFPGDLGAEEEQNLLKKGLLKDCDLLKVAHHGSRYSSSIRFLETVSPEIAVISAGVRNSYGHPHTETLKRLSAVCSDIYCTAEYGEIEVTADVQGHYEVRTMLG